MENTNKKFNLKFWHGLVLMGALALFFHIRGCTSEKNYQNEVAKNLAYKDTLMTYKAQDGTVVDYNLALQTKLDAFFEAQNDSIRDFLENIKIPEPDMITIYKDRFYVDSIPSVSLGLTDCDFDTTFTITDPYYEVVGRVNNEELSLKSIMVPNKTTLVVGDRKEKWWKRSEYIVTVTNSNPYIQSESIQSYNFQEKQSRWSIGPSLGYSFYYDPWKGNVGHGLTGGISINYRLIGWKNK